MKEYILIDGYNVIENWRDFKKLREESLEHARELLVAWMSEYSAFKGYRAVVVFDAQKVASRAASEKVHGIEVVFTGEGETADSWIERSAHDLARGKARVFVVTSDYAEQLNVMGSGAYRISAREFREQFYKAKREIASKLYAPKGSANRNELWERIDGGVLQHLETLRGKS